MILSAGITNSNSDRICEYDRVSLHQYLFYLAIGVHPSDPEDRRTYVGQFLYQPCRGRPSSDTLYCVYTDLLVRSSQQLDLRFAGVVGC